MVAPNLRRLAAVRELQTPRLPSANLQEPASVDPELDMELDLHARAIDLADGEWGSEAEAASGT